MTDTIAERGSAPVVNTILAINLIVAGVWLTETVPVGTMAEHFLVSWRHLEEGRIWTLLTSAFSHTLLFHLLVNVIVLVNFGPPIERLLGSGKFLAFYLTAGLAGSLAHAVVSNFLMDEPERAALGASGALSGVLLLFALLYPRAPILLFFVIPLPAIVAALAFIAIDVWGMVAQIEGGGLPIGHGAHLGGALTGIVYFLARRRSLREAKRALQGL